jgi:hypothetical protein
MNRFEVFFVDDQHVARHHYTPFPTGRRRVLHIGTTIEESERNLTIIA